MLFLGALFFFVALLCGVPAFAGDVSKSLGLYHFGFLVGVVGFVSCAVVALARWAMAAVEDGDHPVRLPPDRR